VGWQYEPKWDGFRCLVYRDGDTMYLQSEAGQPLARYFPEVLESLHLLAARHVRVSLATMGAPLGIEQRGPAAQVPGLEVFESRFKLEWMESPWEDVSLAGEWLLELEARRRLEARMVIAGPLYPADLKWPANVERITHLNPPLHRSFYNAQGFTLNITRADMVRAGYSPSVRLFEAADCGTPIITDVWPGLDSFFVVGSEILVARTAEDTLRYLCDVSEEERRTIGQRARPRVLQAHTAEHRAAPLESYVQQLGLRIQRS
jgi:spore maturation protein CgeB